MLLVSDFSSSCAVKGRWCRQESRACFVGWWAEGPVEVSVLYRPLPGADVGWQGPVPRMETEPPWPLCPLLPPCQADVSTQHFSFWFVLPVCAGGSGRVSLPWGSRSSPDSWAWGQDVCEANQAPTGLNNYMWQLIWVCACWTGGPRAGAGEPRPPRDAAHGLGPGPTVLGPLWKCSWMAKQQILNVDTEVFIK